MDFPADQSLAFIKVIIGFIEEKRGLKTRGWSFIKKEKQILPNYQNKPLHVTTPVRDV